MSARLLAFTLLLTLSACAPEPRSLFTGVRGDGEGAVPRVRQLTPGRPHELGTCSVGSASVHVHFLRYSDGSRYLPAIRLEPLDGTRADDLNECEVVLVTDRGETLRPIDYCVPPPTLADAPTKGIDFVFADSIRDLAFVLVDSPRGHARIFEFSASTECVICGERRRVGTSECPHCAAR